MVIARLNHHIPQTADSSSQPTPDSYTITVVAAAGHKRLNHTPHSASRIRAEECEALLFFRSFVTFLDSCPEIKNVRLEVRDTEIRAGEGKVQHAFKQRHLFFFFSYGLFCGFVVVHRARGCIQRMTVDVKAG